MAEPPRSHSAPLAVETCQRARTPAPPGGVSIGWVGILDLDRFVFTASGAEVPSAWRADWDWGGCCQATRDTFLGRPPFASFARAVWRLAAERTEPPRLPSVEAISAVVTREASRPCTPMAMSKRSSLMPYPAGGLLKAPR